MILYIVRRESKFIFFTAEVFTQHARQLDVWDFIMFSSDK